jgi:hypothetical protein
MVRYFGPDNGSAYFTLPDGRPAVGRVALVFADETGIIPADILDGDRNTEGVPVDEVVVDANGRLNFWFPDEQPTVWVTLNGGPLVRVTADLQDQLDDAAFGGGGGGVTIAELDAAIAAHSADTTAVHGVADTAPLETTTGAQNKANAAQATAIAAAAADATAKVSAHTGAADPHGDRAFATAGLAGKADLVGGLVPSSQIPAIAVTEFLGNVGSQAAMLALTGQKGDWAIRTDTVGTWVITGNNPTLIGDWTQIVTPGGGGGTVTSVNGNPGPTVVLAKGDIGLGSVDDTSDAGKPVSTAQQTALNLKANLAGPTFTGTVSGITKAMVGLSNVDNTADASKTFTESQVTGLVADLAAKQPLDSDLTTIAGLTATTDNMIQAVASAWASRTPAQVKTALAIAQADVSGLTAALSGKEPTIAAGTTAQYWRGDKSWQTLDKTAVGLANVNNTTDAAKPISTATQTALDAKADLVGGLVPTAQLPALAITEVFAAASQAAMLALTAQRGDVALRSDNGKTFILSTDSPGTLADWKEVQAIGVVQSVAGQTGVVVLAKGDVGLGNVDNTSDANKPVSTAQQTALNLKADLASPTFTGTPALPTGTTAVTQTAGDNTTKLATTAFVAALGALKANLASPTFTGTVAGITAAMVGAPALSVVTTKGDLYAATGSGAVARLAVGANGTVPRANSANANGWETANSNQSKEFGFTGTAVVQAGTMRWYNRTGRTLNVVGCWVSANTAPTGAAILVDVNKNGTTIYTTQGNRPTVAISGNGGVLTTPDITTIADGDYITADIDQIGSTVAGANLVVGVVFW